jgi:monoamine oxidase
MNRRDFLRQCAQLAACVPALSVLGACGSAKEPLGLYRDLEVNFDGSVLVIGAGAAGLAAGRLLGRYGIEYQVLEASDRLGGRVLQTEALGDFPIDLGAEWIHVDPSILASLIDDPSVHDSMAVIPYVPESLAVREGSSLSSMNWGRNYYQDHKFHRSTWYHYLERYIAPDVVPNIRFEHPVSTIDYSGRRVVVTTRDGTRFEADRLVITVPIKVLQDGLITFVPSLNAAQAEAVHSVWVPPGIKVFTEFDRRFYPDLVLNGPALEDASSDKLYYNAAFRKDSSRHVMGHFWVADEAARLTDLGDDEAIVGAMLDDLDRIFGGQASRYHRASVVQNWSAAPFIRGAYSSDFSLSQDVMIDTLDGVDPRLTFAGEAFADDSATVHGAMRSGYDAVVQILRG